MKLVNSWNDARKFPELLTTYSNKLSKFSLLFFLLVIGVVTDVV
jgi:hypothetical protein